MAGSVASVTYQEEATYKHFFASYVAAWGPVQEPVLFQMTNDHSFGPSPASITAIGSDAIVAFAGDNNDLFDQTRSVGAWQGAHPHGLGYPVLLSPTIVALASGPSLMIVFVRSTDARIMYTTRTGSTWAPAVQVNVNALTNEPVSLAALPSGDAVLAYRGQDGKVYWSRYTAVAAWSTPTGVATPNFGTPSPPAVSQGASGADAEMVYVDTATGAAVHARLNGMSWSAPVSIGGSGLTRVAIAAMP